MVKTLFKQSRDALFSQQANILTAAGLIAITILISRVLGLFKYRILTSYFTVSEIGIFLAAFRLPNFLFDLIVIGSLTTAFIPIYTSYLNKNDESANQIAATVINASLIILVPLLLIFVFFAHPIMRFITPGFSDHELVQLTKFTQIILLAQTPPLIIGNFLTGILQSHKRFLIPAIAPILYNLGIILGIILLPRNLGLMTPVIGVVLGSLLFLLIQIPMARALGFIPSLKLHLSHPGVRKIGNLAIPRFFGLIINQLNFTINLALSSMLSARGVTIFNFAQQLQQVPIALFGTTISQAALPTLSEEHSKDDREAFNKTFRHSFLQILFFALPAAAVLIILRIPIVRLVYGASKFDWNATVDTGRTLAFLALALVFESLTNLIVRAFYALHIGKTPTIIGAITVVLNITLSVVFLLVLKFPIWGLAAAAACADIVYSLILLFFLDKKTGCLNRKLIIPSLKMFFCAVATVFSLYVPMKLLDQLVFDTTRTIPLIWLTATASVCGLSVYLFLTWVFDIHELEPILAIFSKMRRFFQKKEVLPLSQTTDSVSTESLGTRNN